MLTSPGTSSTPPPAGGGGRREVGVGPGAAVGTPWVEGLGEGEGGVVVVGGTVRGSWAAVAL